MRRITDWVHDGLRGALRPGDWAVDATLGNGHDTAILAECVGPTGRIWGLDVQKDAVASATARLGDAPGFTALVADHAHFPAHLPAEARGRLRAVVFNLGWLPGGDHGITTRGPSTVGALDHALAWLAPGGVISCVCYPGHPEENRAVQAWFSALPTDAGHLTRVERLGTCEPAPFLLWFEKHGGDHAAR